MRSFSLALATASNLQESAPRQLYGSVPFGKKGLVMKDTSHESVGMTNAQFQAAQAGGLEWHYDWRANASSALNYSVPYVPMFWGNDGPVNDGGDHVYNFDHATNAPMNGTGIMFGFNEPDNTGATGGSDIPDINYAVALWMKNVDRAKAQGYTKFAAPCPMSINGSWLTSFLDKCATTTDCPATITYLTVHMYEPKCATISASGVAHWNHDVYIGKRKDEIAHYNSLGLGFSIEGVFVTEFAGDEVLPACPVANEGEDWCQTCNTHARQQRWMEMIVPLLEADDAVLGYTWFSRHNSNIFSGNSLNSLGQKYFELTARRLLVV